jgi:hypothetical protein
MATRFAALSDFNPCAVHTGRAVITTQKTTTTTKTMVC